MCSASLQVICIPGLNAAAAEGSVGLPERRSSLRKVFPDGLPATLPAEVDRLDRPGNLPRKVLCRARLAFPWMIPDRWGDPARGQIESTGWRSLARVARINIGSALGFHGGRFG